jgi:hypothetical protein
VSPLEQVLAETRRYEHPLFEFTARESELQVELVIRPKLPGLNLHEYIAPIHPSDLAHPQFPWTFQRYLYDCLHDYIVEHFTRTPQIREVRP